MSLMTISCIANLSLIVAAVKSNLCGLQSTTPPADAIDERIFGGVKSVNHQFPWLISIQVEYRESKGHWKHICTGSLIEPDFVLTAAHCHPSYFWDRQKDKFMINPYITTHVRLVAGCLHWQYERDPHATKCQVMIVSDFLVNPVYLQNKSATHDVGYIRLPAQFNMSDDVGTICLPASPHARFQGMATIAGWGIKSKARNQEDGQLHTAVVNILTADLCDHLIDEKPNPDFILCVGLSQLSNKRNICPGDSGGPLMVRIGHQSVVIGIAARADCDGDPNGMYIRLTRFLAFIRERIDRFNKSKTLH
jgi:hypothetical protein